MADKLKIWTRFECTTLSRQMNNSTRSVQCWRLYYNTCGYLPSRMLSFSIRTDTDVHNDHSRAVLRFGYIKWSYSAVQFMRENTRDHQVTKLRSRSVGKLLLNGNKTTCVYITRYNKGRLNTLFSKYVGTRYTLRFPQISRTWTLFYFQYTIIDQLFNVNI